MLIFAAKRDECWSHLSIGKPHCRNWGTSCNQFLANDETIDCWSPTATVFGWPGETDPAFCTEIFGKFFGIAVDPRIGVPSVFFNRALGKFSCLFAEQLLVFGPSELHGITPWMTLVRSHGFQARRTTDEDGRSFAPCRQEVPANVQASLLYVEWRTTP